MSDTRLKWSPEYETGIKIIDEQHQRLFGFFAEIEECITKRDAARVETVVNGLVNYAISHNTFEESMMAKANYPFLDAHHKIHETFKDRVNEYMKRMEEGVDPLKVAEQLRVYIGLWLIGHVKSEDRDYVPYVKKITNGGFISSMLSRFFR